MWLASVNGGVICVDLPSSKITEYAMDTNNPSSIGRFKVVHIFEDSRGKCILCTIGSGIYEISRRGSNHLSHTVLRINVCRVIIVIISVNLLKIIVYLFFHGKDFYF